MNVSRSAATGTVIAIAMMHAGVALSQANGNGGFAADTRYQLMGTDEVSFGPGVQYQARKELVFKLDGAKEKSASKTDVAISTGELLSNAPASGTTDSSWSGSLTFDRIDFLKPGEARLHDVTDGLSYSAGIDVESTEDFRSKSEIVSSRQLGIHYGRLGSENYSAVDLGVTNFSTDESESSEELLEDKELWSLGVTTGRRFSLTGLDAGDPLWTVSLRGQFNLTESTNLDDALESQQWYLSPGLQWKGDTFRLTADVLMPFMQAGELEEDSEYRVRAKIQKRF